MSRSALKRSRDRTRDRHESRFVWSRRVRRDVRRARRRRAGAHRRQRQPGLYVGPQRSLSLARGLDRCAGEGEGAGRWARQVQGHAWQEREVDAHRARRVQSMAGKEVARLNVYATLKGDEDVRIAVNQERVQLGQALQAAFGEKIAWVAPEILAHRRRKGARVLKSSRRNWRAASTSISTTSCAARRTRSARSRRRDGRGRQTCSSSPTISTASCRTASCRSRA